VFSRGYRVSNGRGEGEGGGEMGRNSGISPRAGRAVSFPSRFFDVGRRREGNGGADVSFGPSREFYRMPLATDEDDIDTRGARASRLCRW
jgi:hypothetical protein